MKNETSIPQSSLAWFNLARLVSQREKEKALGLYKLLSYSFEDKAFALQVEGDLLLAFEDRGAVEKYFSAAFLYKRESKLISAISIYEHILSIEPKNYECISSLIEAYALLDWRDRLQNCMLILLKYFDQKEFSQDQVLRAIKIASDKMVDNKNDEALSQFKKFLTAANPKISEYAKSYFN